MNFQVRARDQAGVTRNFLRTAATRDELMVELRTEKLLILSVTEQKPTRELPSPWNPVWLKPMTGFDVELGLRQIASMLRSGLTLLTSVRTVAQESLSPWARLAWMRVGERIVQGRSFADALSEQPKRFCEIVIRLVEVGEHSGELEHAVSRAADQLESRRNLRSQVINALVYPILAVTMAVGVSAFLVVAVIPKVAEFLRAGGAELPALTQMLMDISDWVVRNGLSILVGVVAAIVAWVVVRLNALGREAEDVFLLHLPVAGRILRLSATALFARSLQIMTESGVTLLDALTTASRLLRNRRFRRRVADAHDAVMRGASLADGLRPAREFTPMLRCMAAVGETTGALPETFAEAARFHELLLALAIKRFGMLIEPVMIVITGGIVGFVYIAFFMAIFAMSGTN